MDFRPEFFEFSRAEPNLLALIRTIVRARKNLPEIISEDFWAVGPRAFAQHSDSSITTFSGRNLHSPSLPSEPEPKHSQPTPLVNPEAALLPFQPERSTPENLRFSGSRHSQLECFPVREGVSSVNRMCARATVTL